MSCSQPAIVLAFVLLIANPLLAQEPYEFKSIINPANVTIARDSFGVPHIFGKTDAEAAYGLAWANAEDGFETMQESLLLGKGMMARMKGKDGAMIDFFGHSIGARDIVRERFFTDLTPEYIRYLEGYCQGLNAFAEKNPGRVLLKKAFPVTPKDIMQAYVVTFSALTSVADRVGDVVGGKYDEQYAALFGNPKDEDAPKRREQRDRHDNSANAQLQFDPYPETFGIGSNAFAMNAGMTENGNTYLCINPHMLVDGPLSFYEAHLSSEEGLNITGALFQGGTCVFMGNNEHLGWTHTFNHFDGVDVYALKMNDKDKLEYELDGKYYPLEKRPVWLKVKIKKWLPAIPVKKTTYWSEHHGPVFKSKGGHFYAVKALAYTTIKSGQQFYYMDKARNFTEFKKALDMQGMAMFNVIYADKDGNIYYRHNGLVPDRKAAYAWAGLVPGNDSKYIWDKALPVDELPGAVNPDCGYIFNTNNTPYNATCYGYNDSRSRLPDYVDGRPCDNNRSMRFMELVNSKPKFTFEDFKKIKFDYSWPQTSDFQQSVSGMYNVSPEEYPEIADVIAIVKSWNKVCDTTSVGATVFGLMMRDLLQETGDDGEFTMGVQKNLAEEDFVKAYKNAKAHLMQHFGTVNVPLGNLQRYVKGGKDYAIPGYPDALMANYPQKPYKNGMYQLEYGDTYIQFVEFTKNGAEKIESLLPYNAAATASEYKDQTLLYQKLQTKKATLSKDEVMKGAMKVYQPK